MNYQERREELMAEIELLLEEEKVEEANAKMAEVESLDAEWEGTKLAKANLEALKEKNVEDITNHSQKIEGGTIVDKNEKTEIMNKDKVYLQAWAKSMQGKKIEGQELEVFNEINQLENAFTHTTGNTSIVPTEVAEGIWARAEELYPFLEDARKFEVDGQLVINRHTGIAAGDAAWYDEATATADEQNAFDTLTLSGCELAKAITITWKLKAMAVDAFIPYITRELGNRVGAALGTAMFRGKGVPGQNDNFKPEPLGVETALAKETNTPQIVTYNPAANPAVPATYDKLAEVVSKVHSSYLQGAAFYANNKTIWEVLAVIKTTEGRPAFVADPASGGIGRIFGFPVKADAGVTDGSVIFGNAGEGYVKNTSEAMSVATEDHVKTRLTDYAAYTIVDGAPIDLKAFAQLKKSS